MEELQLDELSDKQKVIETGELFIELGIMETDSTDLKESVEFIINKMLVLKEDLLEKIELINRQLAIYEAVDYL